MRLVAGCADNDTNFSTFPPEGQLATWQLMGGGWGPATPGLIHNEQLSLAQLFGTVWVRLTCRTANTHMLAHTKPQRCLKSQSKLAPKGIATTLFTKGIVYVFWVFSICCRNPRSLSLSFCLPSYTYCTQKLLCFLLLHISHQALN